MSPPLVTSLAASTFTWPSVSRRCPYRAITSGCDHELTPPGGLGPAPSLAPKPDALAALEHYKQKDMSKGEFGWGTRILRCADSAVVVRFKSIGSAPIMKNNVFKVTAGNKFQAVVVFLRQQLGLKTNDPLVS